MRIIRVSLLLLVALAAASAAELKVKVVDPQSAAVSGAQVSLFVRDMKSASKVAATSPEGVVIFSESQAREFGTY